MRLNDPSFPHEPGVIYKYHPIHNNYLIGNDGSVWSNRGGRGRWKPRSLNTDRDGYKVLDLYDGTSNPTFVKAHRLVLETFVGPCPPGMEGCHNDGDPANNRLSNLRWDTRSSNYLDKRRHGTANDGCRNPSYRITPDMRRDILTRRLLGETAAAIAMDYGIGETSVYRIASQEVVEAV